MQRTVAKMPWLKVFQADSRSMAEIQDASVDLIVTSPPYWHIKDYGVPGQIGYGQSLHEYLVDLYRVWKDAYRVLRPGRRLCINIGDQFARAVVYGRYKVIPLHAEIIAQAEQIGFDYMGAIIWQKRTTMNTTGGAVVMGSYPYPPNGIVEIDYEYILIFKKPGKSPRVSREQKEASRLTKEEWKTYFTGHWTFGGARQVRHEAVFPDELPRRLIRMFSFTGETVLDPFAGSGTTLVQALLLGRNAIGYEIHPDFVQLIRERVMETLGPLFTSASFHRRESPAPLPEVGDYVPRIQDARPEAARAPRPPGTLYRVRGVESDTLVLENGLRVGLLGIAIVNPQAFAEYVRRRLRGKQVFLKPEPSSEALSSGRVRAYVYLKNRIFVNAYVLKAGWGRPSDEPHRLRKKFARLWEQHHGQRMDSQSGHQSLGAQ